MVYLADHPALALLEVLVHLDVALVDLPDDYVMLRVPSVIVPQAFNYLLNPLHPAAATARVMHSEPFRFDPRLGLAN